jgi:hypothetical protein
MRGAPDPRASTGRLRGLTSLAKGSQLSRFPRPVVTPGSFHPSGTLRVHFPWSTSQASAVAGKMGRRRSRAAGTCVTICGARSSCVNVGASGSPAGLSRRPISTPTGFAPARIAEQHQKGRNDLRRRQDQHQRARSGRGQALLDRDDGILAGHRRAHRGGARRRALDRGPARPRAPEAACPKCGTVSGRVHSRYSRRLADAAIGGRQVEILLAVRRSFRPDPGCRRRTFAEQVDGLTVRYARKTPLLAGVLGSIAVALAGRAGSRLAAGLGAPASRQVMLRLVMAAPDPEAACPRVLGSMTSRSGAASTTARC